MPKEETTTTVTGTMIPRFDWTAEELQTLPIQEPGLQLLEEGEEYYCGLCGRMREIGHFPH